VCLLVLYLHNTGTELSFFFVQGRHCYLIYNFHYWFFPVLCALYHPSIAIANLTQSLKGNDTERLQIHILYGLSQNCYFCGNESS
jgi:hypothetical protein